MSNKNIFLLIFTICSFYSCVVLVVKLPKESTTSGETTKIQYNEFPQTIIKILQSPKINLIVIKEVKDTIEAVDYYAGRSPSGLLFANKLTEKTIYRLTFQEISPTIDTRSKRGTSFIIKTMTSEAPDQQSTDWQIVSPSKVTKTSKILTEIINADK